MLYRLSLIGGVPRGFCRTLRSPQSVELLIWLREVVPAPYPISQLSSGNVAAGIGDLIGTGGVGAARTIELSAAAGRPDGLDSALCLLNLVHFGHHLQSSHFKIVDGSDAVWNFDYAYPAAAEATRTGAKPS